MKMLRYKFQPNSTINEEFNIFKGRGGERGEGRGRGRGRGREGTYMVLFVQEVLPHIIYLPYKLGHYFLDIQ